MENASHGVMIYDNAPIPPPLPRASRARTLGVGENHWLETPRQMWAYRAFARTQKPKWRIVIRAEENDGVKGFRVWRLE